jgi:hypothetical protein
MLICLTGQPKQGDNTVTVLFSAQIQDEPTSGELQRLLGPHAKLVSSRDEKLSHVVLKKALEFVASAGYGQIVVHGNVARALMGIARGWSVAAEVASAVFHDRSVSLAELTVGPKGWDVGMTLSCRVVEVEKPADPVEASVAPTQGVTEPSFETPTSAIP